jgi:AbrB family looped-hinge helix DNA binding protein
MTATITVDKAGRVILPKPVRDELQLQAGDSLELESGEDRIVLRPVRGTLPLRRKQGVWVFRTVEPLSLMTVNETVKQVRQDRHKSMLGRGSRSKRR